MRIVQIMPAVGWMIAWRNENDTVTKETMVGWALCDDGFVRPMRASMDYVEVMVEMGHDEFDEDCWPNGWEIVPPGVKTI